MFVLKSAVCFAAWLAIQATAFEQQSPFFSPGHVDFGSQHASYDAELLQTIENIHSLSTSEYTTVSHPVYPSYSVRIKQNGGSFCDESVRSYTGYLSFGARHLFFYLFESRNDPGKDDVILWTNGGPGCSSSIGLLMELGPCRIKDANSTTFNPYSWNNNANIFFIDQPVGVGFSYAEYGESVGTTEEAAKDISAFMRIFFDTFTEFKGRAFHLAGESYGGRYLPTFGAQIYDDNKKAVAAGLAPVNLTSLIIGNGLTDSVRMPTSYYDIQCTHASVEPFVDIAACVKMKKAIPRCEKLLKESCVDIYDEMGCGVAANFCTAEMMMPIIKTGRNFYDISKPCEGGYDNDVPCYPIIRTIEEYLNEPVTRELLGVDPAVGSFSQCSDKVSTAFSTNQDDLTHFAQHYVAELLERGVKVLIYVGTYDLLCNWVGTERFTLALEWTGQENFVSQDLRDWGVNGKAAGKTRSANGLTYATIQGAGHMVPYDKPLEALDMLNRWLDGKTL